jgi:acyl-coenzyme A synthetase/AMP-(fatty) acid ligase
MHGTGLFTSIATMGCGGTLVTLPSLGFDPEEPWAPVEPNGVQLIVIVGDPFSRPMLHALDEKPKAYDLSSLVAIISSGAMWSSEVKEGLIRHHRPLILVDSFGSSEALGFGTSVTSARGTSRGGRFRIGKHCRVFSEDGREILPGSDELGFIARSGAIPLGYYKDAGKSAETFPTINGVRYAIPGDWCKVEADGRIMLLGRGSVCINTGGRHGARPLSP